MVERAGRLTGGRLVLRVAHSQVQSIYTLNVIPVVARNLLNQCKTSFRCKSTYVTSSDIFVATDKKFDKVYIVSPSMKTAKEDPFECLPDEQIEQELTVEFLQRFEEEVKESGEKVLLILDDVVNDIRKKKKV
eukprot:SAG22_NODE_549_length_9239_cov_7.477899_5_plen_133_part_00